MAACVAMHVMQQHCRAHTIAAVVMALLSELAYAFAACVCLGLLA